jgi:pimeloyl-ACP methyl ester carboxylesterase
VLAPLHVDSREHPDTAKFPGGASWKARIEDMNVLIAQLGHQPYVAAGHSYGGLVALTMGGSHPIPPSGMALPLYSRLARAVVAFSPPSPIPVLVTAEGYGKLAVPALIQTGSIDFVPGITAPTGDGWKGHLAPYDAAASGNNRYALVLEGVDHYFGGAICSYDRPGPKQLDRLTDANRVVGLFLNVHGQSRVDPRAHRALTALVSDAYPVRLLHK